MQKNTFASSLIEISALKILLDGPNRIINNKDVYFNWGILWDLFTPLIMVAGWSLLLTAGIRGGLHDIRNFAFILTLWFAFSNHVQNGLNYNPPVALKNKRGVNAFSIDLALLTVSSVSLMMRMLLISVIFYYFGMKIYFFHILSAFFLMCLFASFYLAIVRFLFFKRAFLIAAHQFVLQALFIFSSIILPVHILPQAFKEIILYNPLVHLFEWIKEPYSGIKYLYIDINYFLYFLIIGVIISPICIYLYYKNEKNN